MTSKDLGGTLARVNQIQGLLDRLNPEVAQTGSSTQKSGGTFQEALSAVLKPADTTRFTTGTSASAATATAAATATGTTPQLDSRGFETGRPSSRVAREVLASGSTTAAAAAGSSAGTASAALNNVPENVRQLVHQAAQKYGVDEALILGVIATESGFKADAVSSAGAKGLMQLMPSNCTAAGVTNPFDPAQNIDAGVRQLKQCLDMYHGDVRLALAAYNAGPGAVNRYGGVPPFAETQAYVPKVLASAAGYRAQVSAAGSATTAPSSDLPVTGSGRATRGRTNAAATDSGAGVGASNGRALIGGARRRTATTPSSDPTASAEAATLVTPALQPLVENGLVTSAPTPAAAPTVPAVHSSASSAPAAMVAAQQRVTQVQAAIDQLSGAPDTAMAAPTTATAAPAATVATSATPAAQAPVPQPTADDGEAAVQWLPTATLPATRPESAASTTAQRGPATAEQAVAVAWSAARVTVGTDAASAAERSAAPSAPTSAPPNQTAAAAPAAPPLTSTATPPAPQVPVRPAAEPAPATIESERQVSAAQTVTETADSESPAALQPALWVPEGDLTTAPLPREAVTAAPAQSPASATPQAPVEQAATPPAPVGQAATPSAPATTAAAGAPTATAPPAGATSQARSSAGSTVLETGAPQPLPVQDLPVSAPLPAAPQAKATAPAPSTEPAVTLATLPQSDAAPVAQAQPATAAVTATSRGDERSPATTAPAARPVPTSSARAAAGPAVAPAPAGEPLAASQIAASAAAADEQSVAAPVPASDTPSVDRPVATAQPLPRPAARAMVASTAPTSLADEAEAVAGQVGESVRSLMDEPKVHEEPERRPELPAPPAVAQAPTERTQTGSNSGRDAAQTSVQAQVTNPTAPVSQRDTAHQQHREPKQSTPVQAAARTQRSEAVFSLDGVGLTDGTQATASSSVASSGSQPRAMNDAKELTWNLTRQANLMQSPSSDEFTVALRHPEVGQLSVRIIRQADAVHVSLQTDNEALRHEMQSQLPSLQQSLREHGLQLGGFDVGARGQQQPQQQANGGPAQQSSAASNGVEAAVRGTSEASWRSSAAARPNDNGSLAEWA